MKNVVGNPFARIRKNKNIEILRQTLDRTLEKKFEHKSFADRFRLANIAFLGVGYVAQVASLITAFTMLSFLFEGMPMLLRGVVAIVAVLFIELIKRNSMEDVFKGAFQYKEVEHFPAILGIVAVSASIYISAQGAKILPSILLPDPIYQVPTPTSPDAIKADFGQRIAAVQKMRDNWATSRQWGGRLSKEDGAVIKAHNNDIKALEIEQSEALKELDVQNKALLSTALVDNEKATADTTQKREGLKQKLVITAIGFELVFLFSMACSWWYYNECRKERKEQFSNSHVDNANSVFFNQGTAAPSVQNVTPIGFKFGGGSSSNPPDATDGSTDENLLQQPINTSSSSNHRQKVGDLVKCANCGSMFVANAHNHKHCTKICKKEYRKKSTV